MQRDQFRASHECETLVQPRHTSILRRSPQLQAHRFIRRARVLEIPLPVVCHEAEARPSLSLTYARRPERSQDFVFRNRKPDGVELLRAVSWFANQYRGE